MRPPIPQTARRRKLTNASAAATLSPRPSSFRSLYITAAAVVVILPAPLAVEAIRAILLVIRVALLAVAIVAAAAIQGDGEIFMLLNDDFLLCLQPISYLNNKDS